MAKQNFDKFIKKEVKGAKKKEQIKQEKKLVKKEREAFFIEKKREQRALKKLQQEQQNTGSYNRNKQGNDNRETRSGKPVLSKKDAGKSLEKPAYKKTAPASRDSKPTTNFKKGKPDEQFSKKGFGSDNRASRPSLKRDSEKKPYSQKREAAATNPSYNKPAAKTDRSAELTRRPKLITASKEISVEKPIAETAPIAKETPTKTTTIKARPENKVVIKSATPPEPKADKIADTKKPIPEYIEPSAPPRKVRTVKETLPIPEEFIAKTATKVNKAPAAAKATAEKPVKPVTKTAEPGVMPLNKYIAHGGVCSRRDAGDLVKSGKVTVNGAVVTEPGTKVSDADTITVSGKKVTPKQTLVYILLNKPKDFITTADDPQGRKTVLDIVRGATPERIFPVGRLDRNTSGVLLITNDGDLAQQLTHPSFEVRKIYEAKLDKPLTKADFNKLLEGVDLEDGKVQADSVAYADSKDRSIIGIEIHSGRNRVVRRMFEHLGYDVRGLDRVMFANLTKKNVDRGKWRFLSDKEVRLLKFFKSAGR